MAAQKQAARSQATRARMVSAARALFATDGYGKTRLDEVVDAAGVTKGALYHHFRDKRDLFAAVFCAEQERIGQKVAAAYRAAGHPWHGLRAGAHAFLLASMDPGTQRITLLDAPAVLGWDAMRELEIDHSERLLRRGIETAMETGHLRRRPSGPLVHLLFGALCEAAMVIARSDDQEACAAEVVAELESLLSALAES